MKHFKKNYILISLLTVSLTGGLFINGYSETNLLKQELKIKGYLYSVKLKTFSNIKEAITFIKKLPFEVRKSCFIFENKDKKVEVRCFLFRKEKTLKTKEKILKNLKISFVEIKTPDIFLYSYQLITTNSKKKAEKFLQKLPKSLKEEAFIYKTDSGFYTVRVFLGKTVKEIKRKLRLFRNLIKKYKGVIVPTSPVKIKNIKKTQSKTAKPKTSKQEKQLNEVVVIKNKNNQTAEIVIKAIPDIVAIPEDKKKKIVKLKPLSEKEIKQEETLFIKQQQEEERKLKKKLKAIIEESQKLKQQEKEKIDIKKAKRKEKTTIVLPKKEPVKTGEIKFKSIFPQIDRNILFSAQLQYGTNIKSGTKSSFKNEAYSIAVPGEVTDGIKYSISLTYSKFYPDDNTWQSTLRPYLSTRLTNDIFTLSSSVGATKVKSSEGRDDKTTTYNINFSSAWSPKYPYLSINLSKNRAFSDTTDSESNSQRISTGYSYKNRIGLNYSFSHSKSTDYLRDTFNENSNHNINLFAKRSFLNGKLFISVSENLFFSNNRYSLKVIGGTYYSKLTEITGFSGVDTTPLTGTLTPNALLTDEDYDTSAGIDLQTPYQNIAIETAYNPVDMILIYVGGNVTETDISTFVWDIYTSDDGNIWTPISTNAPFTYDNQTKSIEFLLPTTISTNYIKLVLRVTGAVNTGYVTEIEAYKKTTETDTDIMESSTYGDTTRANLRAQLPFRLSYFLSYERSSKEGEEITSKITNSLSRNWKYRFYLINAGISRTDSFMKDQERRTSQSANLNIKASPLHTLSWRAGASYSENYIGSQKTTSAITITSGVNARLFTGLNTELSGTATKGTNELTGTSNTAYSVRLSTNARLYPTLTASATLQHNVSTETTDIISLSSTWTPSDILRLTVSQGFTLITNGENTSNTSFNLSIVPRGGDVKYNFGMSSSNGKNSYRGSVYWQISDYFTANGYIKYEDFSDTTTAGANLNARW